MTNHCRAKITIPCLATKNLSRPIAYYRVLSRRKQMNRFDHNNNLLAQHKHPVATKK